MRLSTLLNIVYILGVVNSLIVDTDVEIVCSPSDPHDCYPKLFTPTNEWQTIKEGQDIPPGLHVRLNIDTLQREAKLMDAEASSENNELVLSNDQPDQQQENDDNIELQKQEILKKKIEDFKVKQQDEHNEQKIIPKKSKVSIEDLNDFGSSVEQLGQFQYDQDLTLLEKALDNLIELSHDIEFGAKLTNSKQTFDTLLHIIAIIPTNHEIHEKIYRIMGSSLRNNPEAIENVLNNQSETFIQVFFEQLKYLSIPDIVKKRILGILQALCLNEQFQFKFFNKNNPTIGILKLIDIFPNVEASTKLRIINIFEDLGLIEFVNNNESFDKRSIEEAVSPDHKISSYLQDQLANSKIESEDHFKFLFNKLVELHEKDNTLKPNKNFIEWLSQESMTRQNNAKPRDEFYSNTDPEFDKSMLRARHEVFGNKNAYRKVADEL